MDFLPLAPPVLLIALALAPRGALWALAGWAVLLVPALILLGFAVAITAKVMQYRSRVASRAAGSEERLLTRGPFAIVRHPVYSAVIIVGLAAVLRGASELHIALWLALVVTFAIRARWDDLMRLFDHDREFEAYAARVGRLVPGIGRVRS